MVAIRAALGPGVALKGFMTVNDLVNTSIERAKRWHDGDIAQWSTLEWAGAMCGDLIEHGKFSLAEAVAGAVVDELRLLRITKE